LENSWVQQHRLHLTVKETLHFRRLPRNVDRMMMVPLGVVLTETMTRDNGNHRVLMKTVRGDVAAAAAGLEVILRHVEVALEVIMTVVVVEESRMEVEETRTVVTGEEVETRMVAIAAQEVEILGVVIAEAVSEEEEEAIGTEEIEPPLKMVAAAAAALIVLLLEANVLVLLFPNARRLLRQRHPLPQPELLSSLLLRNRKQIHLEMLLRSIQLRNLTN
jgi:hypothetical protein